MEIDRGQFLAKLTEAAAGLSTKEVFEQSNAFVFSGDQLITFNGDVLVRQKNPLDFDAIVNGTDLMAYISKLPDDTVDLTLRDDQLRVKSKRRQAGFTCQAEMRLPIDKVPKPEGWTALPDGVATLLQQAARTCGKDETQFLSTCVHVMPKLIEACDNFRLFRATVETGFDEELLLHAASLGAVDGLDLRKVSIGRGWAHFKTTSGAVISLRCSHEPYHQNIDALLEDAGDGETIVLPSNLKDMLERAEVFSAAGFSARIGIAIDDNELTLTSQKDSGWYEEKKRVQYTRAPLRFEVNPAFLIEILSYTREATVKQNRLKIAADNIEFLVSLVAKQEAKDEDEQPKRKKSKSKQENHDDSVDDIPF